MNKYLPKEVVDNIVSFSMFCNPHPLAKLFKSKMNYILEELNAETVCHRHIGICCGNHKSFANSFFHADGTFISEEAWNIYYYAGMDWQYVNTLHEWDRNNHTKMIPVF